MIPNGLILFIFLLSFTHVCSQTPLAEIELGKQSLKNVRGMIVGDSIFLVCSQTGSTVTPLSNFYWITQSGAVSRVNLKGLDEKKLITSIIPKKDKIFYYFFEEQEKTVLIKALVQEKSSNVISLDPRQIELPGKLLGSYVDKDLFLICDSKNDFTVKIVQLRDLTKVGEKVFPLSVDLTKNKRQYISFQDLGMPVRPAQAAAPIKIIKEHNAIYITIDEPYNGDEPERIQFKTTVIRLDLNTGLSSIKSFFESSEIPFTSTVYADHVFRVGSERNKKLEIFNFKTGERLTAQALIYKSDVKDRVGYLRLGTNNTIFKASSGKGVSISSMQREHDFIIIDSTASANLVITVGFHGESGSFLPLGSSSIPLLVGSLTVMAIRELSEGPSIDGYGYFEGAIGKGFNEASQISLISQQIDEYEVDQQNKGVKFEWKGYLNEKHQAFAFYLERKSTKLKIMKFERK